MLMHVIMRLFLADIHTIPCSSLFGKGAIKQTWTTKPAQIDS